MSLYSLFKTNPQLEKNGVWLEYGANSSGQPMRVLIARSGGANVAFTKALEAATRPYRRAISAGTIDNSTIERLFKDVFLSHAVLDWVNFEDENGQPLAFTPENVEKVTTDLPDLYEDWQAQARQLSVYRDEAREVDAGNSGRSSGTDSSKAQ